MIIEDYGCSGAISFNWVSLVFFSIPPILLEFIAGVYGCLSIRAFYNRSNKTHNINLNLDSNRYIRLICFSTCDLLIGIPITSFYLYLHFALTKLDPFPGLKEEHENFSSIIEFPANVWRASTLVEISYELNRWIMICGAFVFFTIFGFTEESRNSYRAVLQSVVQVFVKITGIKSLPSSSKSEGCVISFFLFFCSPFNMLIRIVFHKSESSRQLSLTYNHHNNVPM